MLSARMTIEPEFATMQQLVEETSLLVREIEPAKVPEPWSPWIVTVPPAPRLPNAPASCTVAKIAESVEEKLPTLNVIFPARVIRPQPMGQPNVTLPTLASTVL